jgi:hypothetical protein
LSRLAPGGSPAGLPSRPVMYASIVGPIQAATSDLLADANGSMRIT